MNQPSGSEPVVRLERWDGPWRPDDPDANFKTDVSLYTRLDPLSTLTRLGAALDIPVGALCRYVLARWAAGGSEGLLEIGPSTLGRMWEACEKAESSGTDEARVAAYDQLRQMISWLRSGMS